MLDDRQLLDRAVEAYIYAYPLVIMDATRALALDPGGPSRETANAYDHRQRFPDATFTDVVRANVDTLYSLIWYDVSDRPLLLRVPATGDRYYVLPFMDMWTDVFASVGPRTTGSDAQTLLLVGPGWSGTPPPGARVISSPTDWGWIVGRIQTNGAGDYPAVHALQAGFTAEPVELGAVPVRKRTDPGTAVPAPPVHTVGAMGAAEFFERFNALLRSNPPHVADQAQLARIEALGLGPDREFAFADAPPRVRDALDGALPVALDRITRPDPRRARVTNGWRVRPGTGNYGVDYLTRAAVAYSGLGALPPEEAIYPYTATDADGAPLSGAHRYRLHFAPGGLPPAGAFWSLTMYGEDQFMVANPIDRYAIGDRDPLVFGADGALDILLQHAAPGDGETGNWLPAPAGPFSMNLRLYLPGRAAVDGDWAPPAVERID